MFEGTVEFTLRVLLREYDDVLFENEKWQLREKVAFRGRIVLAVVLAGEQSKTDRKVWLASEVKLNVKKAAIVRKVLLVRALELNPVRFTAAVTGWERLKACAVRSELRGKGFSELNLVWRTFSRLITSTPRAVWF